MVSHNEGKIHLDKLPSTVTVSTQFNGIYILKTFKLISGSFCMYILQVQ